MGRQSSTNLTTHLRGHWHIENRLHWVRDTAYHEDTSRFRTRTAPRATATLRNLAAATDTPAGLAVDGKSLHGTFARTGGAGAHLLSALTHRNGTVPAQRQVTAGTSEISWRQLLLATPDLTGVVVTAEALHTTRGLARYLARHQAHYVFTVKANQHRLHWVRDTACHEDTSRFRTRTAPRATLRNLAISTLHSGRVHREVAA
ncbi:hypothetical protein ACWED2_39845 [Amycolatopsis sp. NPDC005003]